MEFLRTPYATSLLWPVLAVGIWFAGRIRDLWTGRLVKGVVLFLFAVLLAPYYVIETEPVSRWPGVLSLAGLIIAAILQRRMPNDIRSAPMYYFMTCALITAAHGLMPAQSDRDFLQILVLAVFTYLFTAAVDAAAAAKKTADANPRFMRGLAVIGIFLALLPIYFLTNGLRSFDAGNLLIPAAVVILTGLLIAFVRLDLRLRAAAVIASGAIPLAAWTKFNEAPLAIRTAIFLASFAAGMFFGNWKALRENRRLIRNAVLHGLVLTAVIVIDLLYGGIIRGNGILAASGFLLGGVLCGFGAQAAITLIETKAWPPALTHAPAAGSIVTGIGLLVAAILLSNTSFRAFEQTARGLFFQSGSKVEAVRDLTKPLEGANVQAIADDSLLLFDGVVSMPDPMGSRSYLRVACMAENKAICPDGKPLFIRVEDVWQAHNEIHSLGADRETFAVYLAKDPAALENAMFTRDFLWGRAALDRVKPEAFDAKFFGGYFRFQPDTPKKAAKILELTALLLIAPEGTTENSFYAHVPRTYAALMRREIFPPAIKDLLTRGAEESVKTAVFDFPFSAKTWAGLAASFNEMPGPARLAAAEQILSGVDSRSPDEEKVFYGTKDGCSKCSHDDAYVRLSMKNGLPGRVTLKKAIRKSGSNEEEQNLAIQQIKAMPLADGLALEFNLGGEKITLEPLARSDYLLRGGPAIEELVRDVPRDGKSIRDYLDVADADEYKRRLVLVVLAALEGGYSKEKGEMVYYINMDQPQDFWIAHAIITRHPMLTREHDWKGSFTNQYFGFPEYAFACGGPDEGHGMRVEPTSAWYKPQASEFRLVYNGGCSGAQDVVCFTDYRSGFEFSFKPSEIKASKPAISMKSTDERTECDFLNRLLPGG